MFETLPIVVTPILVVLVASFLIYRFGFFSSREVSGRLTFIFGSLLILIVTSFEIVELLPDYPDWFVVGAYAAIDLTQFLVGVLGLFLIVIGLALYTDYWQIRREETEERFSKLSILENLQHDARQPYHLLELLNISLREVLVHYPMSVGAVFLVNRTRRQFVLTGSCGLRKEEVAYLEYYPLERNLVSQAVDLGDPMLASRFEFVDRSGQQIASRFKSVLILPLTSGMEKIGCLLLFSEEPDFYGREDIRYLSPVAQWLAEKIRSARLARELSQVTKQRDEHSESVTSLISRLSSSARAGASAKTVDGFCRALVGLAGSESVHLCVANRENLMFVGGSEPLFDLSENFQAALIDGMARSRPLIINQESTDTDGRTGIVHSNLICPLTVSPSGSTLLFIRSGSPFEVNDATLRTIEGFAHLANLILQVETQQRSRLTRRKGFDAVLSLLKHDIKDSGTLNDLGQFTDTLHSALPESSLCLTLDPGSDDTYVSVHTAGRCNKDDVDDLRIPVDEGGLGTVVASGDSLFVYGRAQVEKHLEAYHDQTRAVLRRIFGESGTPDLLAYCPVSSSDRGLTIILAALYGLSDSDRGEWERLIILAAGLYGLRRTLIEITQAAAQQSSTTPKFKTPAGLLNQLNNHLSAVIGLAELAERNEGVTETTRHQLQQILQRADQAANLARQSLVPSVPDSGSDDSDQLHKMIETELNSLHVSGDLYMIGQRPREVRLRLAPVGPLNFASKTLRELFQSVLNRFGALVDEAGL
ncbi:MAG: GAF domain-containing protein [candidate division Zixibacteria bacterium]|nr:GAF domain-containing protein [candidate division Zixibacteria bacterium]